MSVLEKYNIDQLLEDIYSLNDHKEIDQAIDLIMEFFFGNYDFELINNFLGKFDVSRISDGSLLISPAMNTFKYIPKLSNHLPYCSELPPHKCAGF